MVLLWSGLLDTPLSFCRTALMNGLSTAAAFPYYILQHLLG